MLKFAPKGSKQEPSIMKQIDVDETCNVPSDQITATVDVVGKHWEASVSSESYDALKKEYESKCTEVDLLKSHLETLNIKVVELQAEIISLHSKLSSLSSTTLPQD